MDFFSLRNNASLIQHLRREGALKSKSVIEAFQNVDRAQYCKAGRGFGPYSDAPQSIGEMIILMGVNVGDGDGDGPFI